MNALDFCIILPAVLFIAWRSNRSFIYQCILSAGAIGGYVSGALLAAVATAHVSSYVAKGWIALALLFGLAAGAGWAARLLARRIKMRIIQSSFFRADRLLIWPGKVLIVLAVVVLLAQTLVYVPLLSLQFEAQGSSVLMAARRLLPGAGLQGLTSGIAPNRFRHIRLAYDTNPLTYSNITQAGDFQPAVDAVASSVVKVSGRNCVGLAFGSGFIVAPGMVVTNAHVISGGSSIYVADHQGAYPATPLAVDNDHDLAVLYSTFLRGRSIPFASIPATPGAPAVILGYPSGGDLQMAHATITSQTQKSLHNKLDGSNTLTLDNGLPKGSSGGPVINKKGEIIGVNDAGGGGISISIRASLAKALVQKAQRRIIPSSTHLCAVPPEFY